MDILEEEHREKTEEHKENLDVENKEEPIVNSDTVEEKRVVEEPKEEKVEEKEEVKEEEKPVEEEKVEEKKEEEIKKEPSEPKEPLKNRILNFYDKQYKKLMIIPILMLILAIVVIGVQTARTGSFIHKDVSLSGGVTLTINVENDVNLGNLEGFLESKFVGNDISVRSINKGGRQIGVVVVADIDGTDKDKLDSFIDFVGEGMGYELEDDDYSIEIMGSSLGASFFKETIIALIIAFFLMSVVVLIYYRTFIPSLAVVLSAFSDIIVTLAIVDVLGMKLGTGGIAAFLMLVGYSVDTDMLLTTRLLKRKEGSVFDRVISSFKTGMMMTLTTMAALIVGIIFVKSGVIRQIMIIVLIGLVVDMVNTWIQNVGILRYYLKKRKVKNE